MRTFRQFCLPAALLMLLPLCGFAQGGSEPAPPIDRGMAATSGCALGTLFGTVGGGMAISSSRRPALNERGAVVGAAAGCAVMGGAYYVIQGAPEEAPSEATLNETAPEEAPQE